MVSKVYAPPELHWTAYVKELEQVVSNLRAGIDGLYGPVDTRSGSTNTVRTVHADSCECVAELREILFLPPQDAPPPEDLSSDSESTVAFQEELEDFDIEHADRTIQSLLRCLKADNRVNLLTQLADSFQKKMPRIDADVAELDAAEAEAKAAISTDADRVTAVLDNHEVRLYELLWRCFLHFCECRPMMDAEVEASKATRLKEDLLATHREPDAKYYKMTKSTDLVGAASALQHDISMLRESTELDTKRCETYRRTLHVLETQGLKAGGEDEITKGVLREVQRWSLNAHLIRSETAEALAPICRKTASDVEQEAARGFTWDDGKNIHGLLTDSTREFVELTLKHMHCETVSLEGQVNEFASLQRLANDTVPILSETTKALTEATALARLHVDVGCLPGDGEAQDDTAKENECREKLKNVEHVVSSLREKLVEERQVHDRLRTQILNGKLHRHDADRSQRVNRTDKRLRALERKEVIDNNLASQMEAKTAAIIDQIRIVLDSTAERDGKYER